MVGKALPLRRIFAGLHRIRSGRARDLVGREAEVRHLLEALAAGRSVFLSGPPGIGKTAVAQAAASRWEAARTGRQLLYLADCSTRKQLLRCQAAALIVSLGGAAPQSVPERVGAFHVPESLGSGLRTARVRELRDFLRAAEPDPPAALILDHIDARGARLDTFVENALANRPLVLVAECEQDLRGASSRLFDFERLELSPLASADTERLAALWLPGIEPSERRLLARLAAGNPGRLQRLVRLAREPRCRPGGNLSASLLRLELRLEEALAGIPQAKHTS
jgi:hypothetical protein